MRLNGQTITATKQALSERRQFTMGDQLNANEMLAQLSRAAQQAIKPEGPKPDDSDEIRRLKRKGLYEIALLVENDEHEAMLGIEGQGVDAAYLAALVKEAARDYVVHESHARGVPASIAAAIKERAEMAAKPLQHENAGRLDGIEANHRQQAKRLADADEGLSVLTEYVQKLDARIAALESAAQSPEAAPAEPPEAISADTKGQ